MTSGSDDLEQELRRNLKLRRELGAEAAKGKAALNAKQRGGVAYRLKWFRHIIHGRGVIGFAPFQNEDLNLAGGAPKFFPLVLDSGQGSFA